MGMTIDDLKAYCMEQEHNHRLDCKRYDDASGYTRSKNKDIRTACAIREELLGNYYQQIAQTLRKHQKIMEIVNDWKTDTWTDGKSYDCMIQISEVAEDVNESLQKNKGNR